MSTTEQHEEVDPTKTDKRALASEMRYVATRLLNMREAITSRSPWARLSKRTLWKAADILSERARLLDGGDFDVVA